VRNAGDATAAMSIKGSAGLEGLFRLAVSVEVVCRAGEDVDTPIMSGMEADRMMPRTTMPDVFVVPD
jgi:hypothetical protein